MILYHGTNMDFTAIDLTKSQRGKDFGCGFYLSELESQAEEMAKFKVQLFGGQSIVQSYEFDEGHLNDGTLRFLRFDGYSKDWATFILANRQNKNAGNIHDYESSIVLLRTIRSVRKSVMSWSRTSIWTPFSNA